MIDFNYEIDFELSNEVHYSEWISRLIETEGFELGGLTFIFCSDSYLLDINLKYLNHDTFTDIITFDYCEAQLISGDIFISVERVTENALKYKVSFSDELLRVMAHGVLHLLGFKDKSSIESELMRSKEEEKIKLFHVEH